jgi:hypothetical protein
MSDGVMRSRRLVAVLLVGLWCPSETWAVALLALSHHPHHVAPGSWRLGSNIVVHHHEVTPAAQGIAAHADDHRHADHSRDDHVIHRPGARAALAAKRLTPNDGPPRQLVQVLFAGPAPDRGGRVVPRVASSTIGPAPPIRTVVLRI